MSNVPNALLATAMALPSGAQHIASMRAPRWVNWTSAEPSGDHSQTSSAPVLAETYEMWSPVGDHIGMNVARCPTPPIPMVSLVGGPPRGETLQSSGLPPSDEAKMICEPSGDHWGASLPPTD